MINSWFGGGVGLRVNSLKSGTPYSINVLDISEQPLLQSILSKTE
jgi:hypothetical protein